MAPLCAGLYSDRLKRSTKESMNDLSEKLLAHFRLLAVGIVMLLFVGFGSIEGVKEKAGEGAAATADYGLSEADEVYEMSKVICMDLVENTYSVSQRNALMRSPSLLEGAARQYAIGYLDGGGATAYAEDARTGCRSGLSDALWG